ncbi:hypothetical protein PEC301296_33190 [Pectobacterium carotovorum subsp. carotovorum]|nr:hypothetical protein GZ59_39210 [Pectobacterium atrosepticum]POW25493.1 sn-glycerol-3-phosphate ABC transporter ATP-binding protein UgpC [Pectobacterium atrosepticum]GKV87008.1 hypothetical protein PEC301296_33190 [Pectobacterium carotovorum subsp. carotovorum]
MGLKSKAFAPWMAQSELTGTYLQRLYDLPIITAQRTRPLLNDGGFTYFWRYYCAD